MIVMAVLVYLPVTAITAFGVLMITYHNLLDGFTAERIGVPNWVWVILHVTGTFTLFDGIDFSTGYCLIPWIGVMAAGYGFGAFWLLPPETRRNHLLGLGATLTMAFILLRSSNLYGDPLPWVEYEDKTNEIMSFLNCQKYPPSLLYLLMTLGPAIMALALFDRRVVPCGRPILVFGRVPLFFYLIHFLLIHGLAVALDCVLFGASPIANHICGDFDPEEPHGVDLPYVYLAWIVVVLAMYPLCYWFANVKKRHRWTWLSYL
jgi:uncharacterized membrane protein